MCLISEQAPVQEVHDDQTRINVCIGMYIGMRIGMYIDMYIGMCIDMHIDRYTDRCIGVGIEMRARMPRHTCVSMSTYDQYMCAWCARRCSSGGPRRRSAVTQPTGISHAHRWRVTGYFIHTCIHTCEHTRACTHMNMDDYGTRLVTMACKH